ncbi:released from the phage upon host infection [Vibrio phage PVA1]|uniref:released from the phage upon host infection n=1 Tax=Vibrio phage PVA1 TaxID=1461743 RepID=UPI0003F1D6C4|nr:released from the phage upon host infection [Vibrio phage PVA1]AHJ87861.1 DNA injection protein [Vibrio phage PVA1]
MQGYNPDYSGLLGAGAMQANALSQLGQAGGNLIAQQRQQRATDELMGRAREAISTGDPAVISELMITNPDLAGSVQNAINFQSDATRQNLIGSIESVLTNPEMTEQVLTDRIKMVSDAGGDPSQSIAALQEYKSDPEGFLRNAEIAYSIYAPDKYKSYASAKSAGAPEKMTEYQRATIEGKKVDQELRRLEIEEKKLDRQLRRETDQLKKQELEQKLDQTKSEKTKLADADKTKINEGIYQAEQNKRAINDLLGNDDYMDSITGYRGRLPTATTTGVEAEAYLDNIRNSMTIDNLGVMSGPLTDKDIQIIASASSRLRPGMSRSALEKELKTINSAYDRVISNYKKEANRKGYESPTEAKTVNWSDL